MPEAVAAELVAALEVTGAAATAVTIATEIAVTITISLGVSLIEQAILGQPKQPPPHARRENFRQTIAPRVKAYGRCRLGGPYAFLNTRIPPGGTNGVFYQVIVHGQGPFDQFEDWYHNDALIEFASGDHGDVSVPKYYLHGGDYYVKITFKQGDPSQTVEVNIAADWPDQWTSDFRGRGVAYSLVRLSSPAASDFNDIFPAGLPTTTVVARTSQVFDPRDDAQDYRFPASWKWSGNWALNVLDVLKNADGLRLPVGMLLAGIDVWKAAANYCETIRPLKNNGSEFWYRLWGAYQLNDPPKNWLPKMLDVADARLVLRGDGAVVPSIGRWHEPELTLTDNEIYTYANFSKGRPKPDVRNVINGTFVAAEYNYVQQQADPWINEASIDADGEQQATLDLAFAPSHAQARYRMKIESFRQDPDGWCGTIITKAYGLKFLTPNADGSPKRFIRIQISDFAIDTTFEVQKFGFDHKTGRCTFAVQEMSSDAFAWNAADDEGTAPLLAKDTAATGVENPFNLQVAVAGTAIAATLDAAIDPTLTAVVDHRVTDDAVADRDAAWTNLTLGGSTWQTGYLHVGRYDIRARFHNGDSPPAWSDPLIVRGVQITGSEARAHPKPLDTEAGDTLKTEDGSEIFTEN